MAGALAAHYLDAWHAAPEGPEGEAVAVQARLALRGAAERAASLGSATNRNSRSSSGTHRCLRTCRRGGPARARRCSGRGGGAHRAGRGPTPPGGADTASGATGRHRPRERHARTTHTDGSRNDEAVAIVAPRCRSSRTWWARHRWSSSKSQARRCPVPARQAGGGAPDIRSGPGRRRASRPGRRPGRQPRDEGHESSATAAVRARAWPARGWPPPGRGRGPAPDDDP